MLIEDFHCLLQLRDDRWRFSSVGTGQLIDDVSGTQDPAEYRVEGLQRRSMCVG